MLPGGLAQLGEHLLCKQGVVGSIPSTSTKNFRKSKPKSVAQAVCDGELGLVFYKPLAVSFFNNLEEVKIYIGVCDSMH